MSDLDGRVHHQVLRSIVARGRAPSLSELAAAAEVGEDAAAESLRRLHEGHGLVLHPATIEVWAAHPFSLVPTATFVENETRGWWAPCVWCGLGLAELVGPDARLHTRLAGEREPLVLDRDAHGVAPTELVVHFPVSAARAWDNVHRFCATVQVFEGDDAVDGWCARHGQPRGDVRPLEQVDRLARRWYGGYLAEDWSKWTIDEARAIFEELGFDGPGWELPAAPGRF